MVKLDSARSWGYASPLSKIMFHLNINIDPGILLSSSRLIRSKHFRESEQPAPGSTSGRKRKSTAKKPAPAKDKSGGKAKEKIVFMEPPTQDEEESASTSDRTGSQKTDEHPSDREGPNEEEHSGTSPNNTGAAGSLENTDGGADASEEEEATPDDDQKMAAIIVRNILEEIELRVQTVGALYREWHEYRCDKFYKHILPGLTDEQCFRRMKEIDENVISLTHAETLNEARDRCAIVRPRARLQKLTARIRKLKERYVAGTPKANLQLLVLEKLEIAKGEFAEEIDRLEAVYRQREKPHSPAPETSNGQNRSETPPPENPDINETDERIEAPFTEQLETDQPGEKIKKTVRLALLFAEKTRDDLVKAGDRITVIENEYRDDVILHNEHYQQTEDLEDKTSMIKDDMDRFERETEQRFKEVDEDLGRSRNDVGSTLDRVTDLEKKNANLEDRNDKLEADLKALTAQVDELLKAKMNADTAIEEANARAAKEVQHALDEETRRTKETPRLTDEEIAERERITAAKYPGLAKSIAVQAAKDAERLNAQKQGFEEYARAHKKKKTAPSSSVTAKRKRKTSKKAQVAGMLERITETIIENQPDPATHTEDEDEEPLQPRATRQRVSNTVLISTVSQPQAGGSSSRPDQPNKKTPTKNMMDGFTFSESE
ncbi:stress response protein NST1-like [Impatiens glandulifera]|uniref:stress response protein NST1-like n=1 Tax=Impatiens glandulifera TaxID=253017 RepID=UPI001FB085FF|nr:stress response protein NST1-like [Impatiens glandulifera]